MDDAGITEPVKSAPIKTDTTDPSAPTTVTVSAVTTSTVALEWPAGTDAASGVDRYEVYVDGVPAGTSATTSTVLTGLTPNTVYALSVVTVDVAGNRSANSLPVYAVTDSVDVAAPLTTLSLTPSAPDGDNGWYVVAPLVTLTSSEPGSSYSSWDSPVGPFTTYSRAVPGDRGQPDALLLLGGRAEQRGSRPERADQDGHHRPVRADDGHRECGDDVDGGARVARGDRRGIGCRPL